jgi:hypothetical protein
VSESDVRFCRQGTYVAREGRLTDYGRYHSKLLKLRKTKFDVHGLPLAILHVQADDGFQGHPRNPSPYTLNPHKERDHVESDYAFCERGRWSDGD